MLTVPIRETIVEENTCNAFVGLWKASDEEVATSYKLHAVSAIVSIKHAYLATL